MERYNSLPLYWLEAEWPAGSSHVAISLVSDPATAIPVSIRGSYLTAPLLIPEQPLFRDDARGPHYVSFSAEAVARIAGSLLHGPAARITRGHSGSELSGIYLAESWLARPDEDRSAPFPMGTWMVRLHVTDPLLLEQIVHGELRGFSAEAAIRYLPYSSPVGNMASAVLEALDEPS